MVTARTVVLATGWWTTCRLSQGFPKYGGATCAWVSMWLSDVTVVSTYAFDEAVTEKLKLLNIAIAQDEVTGLIHGDGQLVGLTTQSGSDIECDATWIAMPYKAAANPAPCAASCESVTLTNDTQSTRVITIFAVAEYF